MAIHTALDDGHCRRIHSRMLARSLHCRPQGSSGALWAGDQRGLQQLSRVAPVGAVQLPGHTRGQGAEQVSYPPPAPLAVLAVAAGVGCEAEPMCGCASALSLHQCCRPCPVKLFSLSFFSSLSNGRMTVWPRTAEAVSQSRNDPYNLPSLCACLPVCMFPPTLGCRASRAGSSPRGAYPAYRGISSPMAGKCSQPDSLAGSLADWIAGSLAHWFD